MARGSLIERSLGVVDLYVVQCKTASGAIGVQIWEKIRGRRQMIAHIGSAHTPASLRH
ncbi:hypothetical protein SAMN04490240_2144 [Rhodococcus pyridinivorans]|nr:hypothetical protein SAMN04490240_2144 [Rhodococcus pyridinivorans]